MFNTLFSERKIIYSHPGDDLDVHFINVNGEPVIDLTRSMSDFIESWRESTDLSILLQKFEAGDTTALNKASCFYADVSDCPNNLAEWIRIKEDGEFIFNCLSDDVKAVFGSPSEFFNMVGTEKFKNMFADNNVNKGEVIDNDSE